MNFATWAIRRPVPPIALFLVLTLAGLVSYLRLPVTQFPNIDIPIITVTVAQPGAAPAELASQVIEPIEDAIWDVPGVDHVSATAADSLATVTVEFDLGVDSQRALNDIEDAVAGVQGDLPGAIEEPLIERLDVTGFPILTYAVADPTQSIGELSEFVDDVVARRLQGAQGVGEVSRIGGSDTEVKVDLDPDRLLALGITATDVNDQLRAGNIDLGGGRGDIAGQEFSIRALGAAQTLDELAARPITLSSGAAVRLDRLGEVSIGPAVARNFAMLDGQPVIAIGILRQTGASDLTAGDNAKAILAEIGAEYPSVQFTQIDDTTEYTAGNFESAMHTLYEGAALAVIVVFVFLRNWRATLITALALPLSIIPTFFVMSLLGFSLNTVSLLGITLVTGILVDDAIVEIENIVRHVRMGRPPYEASEEAANEIGLTVIAISFTIVAVFAPVSFMGGIAGQYFRQFGLTVAVAVLFSLLVARLITPMVSAYFIRDTAPAETEDGFIMRRYQGILRWTLRNRGLTLMMGVAIFAASIYSATLLPTEFIPEEDIGRSSVSIELPPGATLEDTRIAARRLTERIGAIPEVESVFVDGGSGAITQANLSINYGPKGERERSFTEIEAEIRQIVDETPDLRAHLLNQGQTRDVTVNVLGDTQEVAQEAALRIVADMADLPMLVDPGTSATLARPEVRIVPRPELAAELGVTASALATTARIATIGDAESNLARFTQGERRLPVVVRFNERARNDLTTVQNARVPSSRGGQVPLGIVADLYLSSGPAQIERYDRQYRISVQADLAPDVPLGPALAATQALPSARDMPPGARIQEAGDAEVMAEIFASFGLAMGAGILMVYVVLVLLFGSFVTPVAILLSLPLAIGGAIIALWLGNYAIGLSVVIGFLMLMGIVTKNAIMLVEFALEAMHAGAGRTEALLDAGHKRARPIVMTTAAMTAGMVPSALAIGTGGEFRAPMAIAVIGGLLLSTLLSLIFVPSLFSVVDGTRSRGARFIARLVGVNRPTGQAAE